VDEHKQVPDRLTIVETEQVRVNTTFKVAMSFGVICWALTSGVIVWFLNEITANMAVTQELVSDIKLVEYRLGSQDRFNSDILQDFAQRKQEVDTRFRELEVQMHNSYRRDATSN
jgi:hypothetical protein